MAEIFGTESDRKTTEKIVTLLVGLLLLGAVAGALLNYLDLLLAYLSDIWYRILEIFYRYWPYWKICAVLIVGAALIGIIRNMTRLNAINEEERKIFSPNTVVSEVTEEEVIVEPKNERWEKILVYMNSTNASDWRLAIIEADVMLEDLLRAMDYTGESVGEMLKSVDKNEFTNLDAAWYGHKIRNQIAHAGGDFQLNERETKHTIAQFEKVFREFDII